MAAAAKHLASVTLELGGKSPVIIAKDANLQRAASQVAWGKLLNNGQICIAPDYCLVHEQVKDAFLALLKTEMQKLYGHNPSESADYARIVSSGHHQRLSTAIKDALTKGARLEWGGTSDAKQRYLAPTVLSGVSANSQVLQEEIFGPILPIRTFSSLDEAIRVVQEGEPPLALYLFSGSKSVIQKVADQTRSGALSVNQLIAHFAHSELPFGGVNNSGIGKSQGKYGFLEFSNARAYYRQRWPGLVDIMRPPYTDFKKKLVNLAMRWF
jgi:aldehyde dehydrogenase (NAD+)